MPDLHASASTSSVDAGFLCPVPGHLSESGRWPLLQRDPSDASAPIGAWRSFGLDLLP